MMNIALAGMLATTLMVPDIALAAPRVSHQQASTKKAHPPVPNRNTIRNEGDWFQLSHLGKKKAAPDARIKALAQAKKLPRFPLGGKFTRVTSSTASRTSPRAASGTTPGAGQPLGPQPLDTGAPPYGFGLVSGRITAEAVNPTNSNDVWVGAADGGVWNSTDGGLTWSPMTDTQATLSTGAIAIDPTNPNIIYVGTGEANFNADAYWGAGILKSTDHGLTWTQLGFSSFGGLAIAKLAIDPGNHLNILAAAAFDGDSIPPGGPSYRYGNEGIWQSTDGGNTWTLVLHDNSNGNYYPISGTDVIFDSAHSGVVYAGMGGTFGGGTSTAASGVYKSTNSGATWTQVTAGMPAGTGIERVSLGISHDGTHIYAALTDTGFATSGATFGVLLNSSIYVSTNSGSSFTAHDISSYSGFADDGGEYQWWYDSTVGVDPNNATTAYIGGVDFWKTVDGGATWTNVTNVYTTGATHPDQHAITFFSPTSSSFYFGNDGGVWSSANGFSTINNLNSGGLNITQFYGGGIGEVGSGAQLYGGAQDNGEDQYTGTSYTAPQKWNMAFGGDGFYTAVDYTNNNNVYEETPYLGINKSTDGGTTWTPATNGIDITDPVNFSAPFVESPNHPNTLVAGTDKVYISTNGGASWTATNGGVRLDQTVSSLVPISALAFAPSDTTDQTIYAGDNVGNVYVTTNGGTSWTYVSPSFRPGLAMVTGIAVDPTNAKVVFVSYNTFSSNGDPGEHIFRSTDGGTSWMDVSSNLPNAPFESVVVAPSNHNFVIAGSDVGIFASPDAGVTWYLLGSELPNVAVNQIFTNHSGTKLFVATHGRGMWELPLLSSTWYFAEGYTGGSFSTYLTLANPNSATANVWVDYLIQGGSPITKTYIVNAKARSTILVNREIGSGKSVSMVVMSDQPIIAERPMYFTYSSPALSRPVPGGTDVLGTISLGKLFNFGYIDTTTNHDTYLTILNPNNTSMFALTTYTPAGGGTTFSNSHLIPANSRGTINVTRGEGLSPGMYSASVRLDNPGLVERPMYLIDSATNLTGSADVIGVQAPLTNWYFAEGYTGNASSTFSERYILSNPGTNTANATVTFYEQGGAMVSTHVTLTTGTQTVVDANSVLGTGVSNSAAVTADQPILAERFMSMNYNSLPGATDVLGAASPGNQFYFAEGYTGNGFTEYLTVENPNAVATTVTATFLPSNGSAPTVQTYTMNANTRFTLNTATVMPAQSFSMSISSTEPIVAERPMYFAYNTTQTGATDVIGYQR